MKDTAAAVLDGELPYQVGAFAVRSVDSLHRQAVIDLKWRGNAPGSLPICEDRGADDLTEAQKELLERRAALRAQMEANEAAIAAHVA